MKRSWFTVIVLGVLLGFGSVAANAQGAKTALSGLVVDSGDGVIPGATVDVKNDATGVSTTTMTNTTGLFAVPALDAGTYTVSVSLQGFKTTVVKNVVLIVGNPGNVKVRLEVGNFSETVAVKGGSELIQTQSTAISSTINATQIQNLPLTSRNVLFGFVIMLPGVSTPGIPRDSTLFGLPENSINITVDGINANNNFQRETDGFYSMIYPQLDAVEQVTVTGAAAGADSATGGSVGIKFVTRSGTNEYRGTAYYFFRHPTLNTNDYFSALRGLPKSQIKLNQYGASEGGPIRFPGYDGRGKAFFFFNHEEFYQPASTPLRTRQMLHPATASGIFRYNVTTGGVTTVQQVDLLALAAANGQVSRIDPTIRALMTQIRSLAEKSVADGWGVITDQNNVNLQQFDYKSPGKYISHLPTGKVDFNLSTRHRLSGSYHWQQVDLLPDLQNNGEAQFPGLPNIANQPSYRTVGSVGLRSTMSNNFVNEIVGGWQWSAIYFNAGIVASQFDNQGGFSLPNVLGATSATRSTNPNTRYQTNYDVKDTVNWLKGKHSLSFGVGFQRFGQHNVSETVVPSLTFGIQSGLDPADGLFTTTNFAGASTDNLNNARNLYAYLTARVTAIAANANLDETTGTYKYLAVAHTRGYQDTWNAFVQDSWRIKPTLTINAGAAWVVQLPFAPGNGLFSATDVPSFCGPYGQRADGYCKGLFQFGGDSTIGKQVPEYNALSKDTRGYNVDWKAISPNIGVAWRPDVKSGWLRQILGDPDQATLRAAFSIGFNQPSVGTGVYGNNPGRNISANRSVTSNYPLVNPGEAWPVLLSEGLFGSGRLGPPAQLLQASPAYPILAVTGNSLNIYDPNLQAPYTRSYSFGLQRSLGRETALEVRYVGTQSINGWATQNWNQQNIYENGFFDEFKKAQSNLRATVAAGLCATATTCTFGYRGAGTGTVPLPIFLAYLTGSADSGNPSAYATTAAVTAFTNTTSLGRLNTRQPAVLNAVGDLETAARMANALAAGLPANFFRMNPTIGTGAANMTMNSAAPTRYDSVVVDLRRRLSQGLLFTTSVTTAWRYSLTQNIFLRDTPQLKVRSTNEVPWALKMATNYELPFGRGRRYGTNTNGWLNGVIGGWAFNMTGRVQAGELLSVSGVTLVGMTEKDLQKAYKLRKDPATNIIYMLPDDIILNTRRAFSTSATSVDGYSSLGPPVGAYIGPSSTVDCVQVFAGDCGTRDFYVRGPLFTRFDMNLKKQFPIGGKKSFQLQVDVLNVFNAINFEPVFNPGSGAGIMQVSSAYQDLPGSYDPGGRLIQLAWRINW